MKAFIINFNLLTWPEKLAEDLYKRGCEVIFVDNNSTYRPLLDWYKSCPYKVIRSEENHLSIAFGQLGLQHTFDDRYFIITDPDLDISRVPEDFINILLGGLALHANVLKAGLSLEISDLPVNPMTYKVIEHESMFWEHEGKSIFYRADIGTTLAVYDRTRFHLPYLSGVRAGHPYTAKHLPWYLTLENLTPEYKNYIATSKWVGWQTLIS